MKITRKVLLLPLALGLSIGTLPAKDKASHSEKNEHAETTVVEKRATEGHRSQDLNGDGVITRNEWPGHDVSFRELDRDGDGALTKKDSGPGTEGTRTRMYHRPVNDEYKKKETVRKEKK